MSELILAIVLQINEAREARAAIMVSLPRVVSVPVRTANC